MMIGEAVRLWEVGLRAGGANGLHPTLRKNAKDGAPGVLRLVKGGLLGARECRHRRYVEQCDSDTERNSDSAILA